VCDINSVVLVCGALRKKNIWEILGLQYPLAELIIKMRSTRLTDSSMSFAAPKRPSVTSSSLGLHGSPQPCIF
jgi:hypothetical protein